MSKPAWDESRKFYASRLPHDWWARVLARCNWGATLVPQTTPGAFPLVAVELCGASIYRVGFKVALSAQVNFSLGNQPFQLTSGVATPNSPVHFINPAGSDWYFDLHRHGRLVQLPWWATQNGITSTGAFYVGELICDVDPFDFDALYGD